MWIKLTITGEIVTSRALAGRTEGAFAKEHTCFMYFPLFLDMRTQDHW